MVFRIPLLLLIAAVLFAPRAASAGGTAPAEPRYDPGASVQVEAIVTEVREVPKGSPMHGVHLTVEAGKETLDVYLAPVDFMKTFDFVFAKGDRLDIAGSKVKFAGATVLLAREVRRNSQTLYLRDASGAPFWLEGS